MSLPFCFNSLQFLIKGLSEEIFIHSYFIFRKMKRHWQEGRRVMLEKCRDFIRITTKSIFKLCRMLLINMTGWFSERIDVLLITFLMVGSSALYLFDIKFMFLTQCPTYKSISNCFCPIWGFEGCKSDWGYWNVWWGETECILHLTSEWYQVIGTFWKEYFFCPRTLMCCGCIYIYGCSNYFLFSLLLW